LSMSKLARSMGLSTRATGGTKEKREPWELTAKEYRNILDSQPMGQSAIPKSLQRFIPSYTDVTRLQSDYPEMFGNDWYSNHRYYVVKALVEGEPVPARALADYPDLADSVVVGVAPHRGTKSRAKKPTRRSRRVGRTPAQVRGLR